MFERKKKYNVIPEMNDLTNYSSRESLKQTYDVYDTASLITKDFSRKQREHLIYALCKTLSTDEIKEHIMSSVEVLFSNHRVSFEEMEEFFEECKYQYDNRHHLENKERESA
jgi:hypothetical protein|tara:strand:+ start:704 stop:1039 length:336 start_codon:yes stop_codon:yes gene_type:complete